VGDGVEADGDKTVEDAEVPPAGGEVDDEDGDGDRASRTWARTVIV
jgi:hypothetical protein